MAGPREPKPDGKAPRPEAQPEAPTEPGPEFAGRPSAPTIQARPGAARGEGLGRGVPDVRLPSRYEPVGHLGTGGMGCVLEAHDRDLGREVAIKVLDTPFRASLILRERLIREARTIARLRHPAIVQIYDIDTEAGILVMELLRGGSVAELLRREGALGAERTLEIVRPVLGALAKAHDAGVVHRDVKPSNILLDENGLPKLCDFGIVRTHDSDLTQEGTQPGTPAYMAPEQLESRETDQRVDVYAVGVSMYEMLTGRRFRKEPPEKRRDPAAALRAEGIDPGLAATVTRAIAEEPEDRFADARELLEALEGPRPHRARWRPRTILAAAIGIVGLVLAAALGLSRLGEDRSADEAAAPTSSVPPVVALFPFENETGNEGLDFAAHGVPRSLGTRLEGTTDGPVVTYDALRDVLGAGDHDRAAWTKVAREQGATVAVGGRIRAAKGGAVAVTARILRLDVDGVPETRGEVAVKGRAAELDALVDRTAVGVAKQLFGGTPKRDRRARKTRSVEAMRGYQLGVDALQRASFSEAIRGFERAVALDPDFPEAWYHMAVARTWSGGVGHRPALQDLDRALEVTEERRERTLLRALRLLMEQRPAEGAELLEPLRVEHPRDRDILYAIGEAYHHGGEVRAGTLAFRAALRVAPAYLLSAIHPIRVYRASRDAKGARYCTSLRRRHGQADQADGDELLLKFALGQYEELLEVPLPASGRAAHAAARARVGAHLVLGNDEAARALLEGEADAIGPEVTQWRAQTVLAAIAYRRGELGTARRWAERAALRAAGSRTPYDRGEGRSSLGLVHAIAGDRRGVEADLVAVDAEEYPPRVPRAVLVFRAVAGWLLEREELLAGALAAQDHDVRRLAEGLREEMRGDHARAAALLARALDEPTEGFFDIVVRHALARNRHALGDHAGVQVVCEDIERPAVYHPYREPALADCRRWLEHR